MSQDKVAIDIGQKRSYDNVDVNIDTNPRTISGTYIYGYHKRIHKPKDGYAIGELKNKGKEQIINATLSDYKSISLFYWPSTENQIFILQLGDGDDYYYTNDSTKWTKNQSVNSRNLLNELDEYNCLWNGIHVADISQNFSDIRRAYDCPSCSKYTPRNIGLILYDTYKSSHQYVRYNHNVGGKVGNVRNGEYTILSVPEGINSLYVYWSTGGKETPLILSYLAQRKHIWYSRYDGDSRWRLESTLTQDPPKETPEKIRSLIQQYSIPRIILNLQREQANSYHPEGNILQFKVEKKSIDDSGYHEYKHSRVERGTFKVKEIFYGEKKLTGMEREGSTDSVSAYYFGENPTYDNLVLIQLGNKYYTLKSGYSWNQRYTSGGLLDTIKKQTCLRKGHILDISQKTNPYKCLGCEKIIQVASSTGINNYEHTRHTHYISSGNFSVSYLVNNNTQKNLPSVKNVSRVHVFWYPKGSSSKPLLVFYDFDNNTEDKWFKKSRGQNNNWETLEGPDHKPSYESDYWNIENILKRIFTTPETSIPSIVINIKNSDNINEPGGAPGEYSDPGGSRHKIQVTAEEFKVGDAGVQGEEKIEYRKYTHKVKEKTHFRLKFIKHGGSRLDDIKSEEELKEIAAYYWDSDRVFGKPLVIMLTIEKVSAKEYEYWERSKSTDKTWAIVSGHGNDKSKIMDATTLKKLLDELKAEYFPPSNTNVIIGGSVGGVLGTGALGFGGYKLWPVLTTLF
ncbi:hypothetical protein BEWA_041540 [Theileria equi strain WA]|uniref:Uncharacterized protein n=1 Tax=Theileria equi strain WA TaxID=1537102 RepID=L1LFI5_THEEQ|nr:hypothetical protein BEWA_041540 [Theileria equi strain WA]EKX74116.1 hypothetical protein BEWA_041540 [Theileria equi strain WA]|eukprot:XP_004833568.1 hypothetical protein BEWA_041540 [Theileria equi strain WA]